MGQAMKLVSAQERLESSRHAQGAVDEIDPYQHDSNNTSTFATYYSSVRYIFGDTRHQRKSSGDYTSLVWRSRLVSTAPRGCDMVNASKYTYSFATTANPSHGTGALVG